MNYYKKIWSVLTVVLALGLGTGCDSDPSSGDDVYSYNVDEFAPGLFGAKSPAMTMNEWFLATRSPWDIRENYDSWSRRENIHIYKDKDFNTPFTGSDMLNEDTVIYCEFSFNGQGKKTGEITGAITLNNIPHPSTTRVYIGSSSYNGFPDNWWSLNGKIDISGVTGTGATLNWSLPVYESLKADSQATFSLIVLPGDSLNTYTVSVPTRKTISDANANVGDLGTVSIRGVTLSGTINVTHNGQPVPYVEIYTYGSASDLLGITCLYSPVPNAPWSVTFGADNNNKEVIFQIFGYSGKNATTLLIDAYVTDPPVYVLNNQSVSGIVLNVGNVD